MHVLVFVKQIPDVNRIEFDATTMRVKRDGVPLLMNSFDRKAVEEAVRIHEKTGATTIAVSMGPPSAKDVLIESVRMGIDRAILVTDRNLSGADTLVTSEVLAAVARKLSPDLILMGKYSLDGETSQVPPEVAEFLNFGFKSSVSRIDFDEGGRVVVEQDREDGVAEFSLPLPAVFSVSEKINKARVPGPASPDLEERVRVMNLRDAGAQVSGSDSPTAVTGTERVNSFRKTSFIEAGEDAFRLVYTIAMKFRKTAARRVDLSSGDEHRGELWGIALNDPDTAMEIASKLAELSIPESLSVKVIGNIPPEALEGMLCHEYLYIDGAGNELLTDTLAELITSSKPRCIVFPSSLDGREIAGAIAARLRLGLTADCVGLKIENGKLIQYKPAFGGGIVARIMSMTAPEMATVRPGIFPRCVGTAPMRISTVQPSGRTSPTRVSFRELSRDYRKLSSSDIIIGVGRGLKSRDNLIAVLNLAGKMRASVGATRPVVDMGWVPRQQQIGLTGTSISPSLYIALGISGQDNHVVGIRYAGTVVAVNNNRDAPIFRYADYGIVCDVMAFLKQFTEFVDRQVERFDDTVV